MKQLYCFMGIVSLLLLIGMVFIYSSSCIYSLERYGYAHYFLKQQLLGLLLALGAALTTYWMPVGFIRKMSPYVFGAALALTLLSFIKGFGLTINGSSRWISCAGFNFQPTELLKISWILLLSHILAQYERIYKKHPVYYVPLLGCTLLLSLVVLKQPDFGNAVLLIITTLLMFFIMDIPVRYLSSIVAILTPIAGLLIFFKPYRLQRMLAFLYPWHDPQGAGFQIIQSLIALGSGGWSGLGISYSKQKFFYLPMQYNDFIYAIIVEETGFIGGLFIISLYIALLYYGLKIGWLLHDTFSRLFIIASSFLISVQSLMHLGVTMGLLPTKGIGLPFISYGKSSLVCLCIVVGFIANLACHRPRAL